MYDLIGDIHGHATELKLLLEKLGYRNKDGCWRHNSRKVIFVGDFIDRGKEIREVLHLVKNMVDHGQALAVMGNHEYNAIAWAHRNKDGSYLRPHHPKNTRQHEETLVQFADYEDEWTRWIEWFYTLPLFLDLEQLRVVHACWDNQHISWLTDRSEGKLNESLLIDAHRRGSAAHTVLEETLKGKEIAIPEQYVWKDKDGHPRTSNRIKWWLDSSECTYGQFLFSCPEALSTIPVANHIMHKQYSIEDKPVFFGHYWLEDKMPMVQRPNVVCLDYSVAKGGSLVGYRFDQTEKLGVENFQLIRSVN